MDILLGGGARHGAGEARSYSVGSRGTVTPLRSLQEEAAEMCKWVNQYLGLAGYSDQLVTDLAEDMSDGITLLRLVHAVSKIPLPRHYPNPMMRVQRMENLSACLKLLKEHNVPLAGVHAQDILSGNVKTVLAVCGALKRHFTSGPSPRQNGSSRGLRRTQISFSSLDKEDMAILSWLGQTVHRDIQNYTMLYDGHILCDLINEIKDDCIPQELVANGSSEERLGKVFEVAECVLHLGNPGVDLSNLHSGLEDPKLRAFLSQIKATYPQQSQQRQAQRMSAASHSSHSRPRTTSREEIFESLRTSSGRAESREDAMIQLRTYDSLKQKKLGASRGSTSSSGREQASPSPPPPPLPDAPPPSTLVASHDQLSQPRGPTPSQQQQRRQRAPLPPREHLSQSRDQLPSSQAHSSKRPLSELYNTGTSSYTDLHTTRTEHAALVKPKRTLQKHSSSEALQQSAPPESQLSRPGSFEVHRSMDTGLAFRSHDPPLSSTWGGGSQPTQATAPILRSHSQSAIQEKPPTPPSTTTLLNKSLTQSTESFNQPTFGGGLGPRRVPSYTRLDSSAVDDLSSQMVELQDRVAMLTTQLLLERADMFKQLKKALAKERRKRAVVEEKLRSMEGHAQQLSRHYDALFIQLAKEVAALKSGSHSQSSTELNQGTSSTEHLSQQIKELKQQIAALETRDHVTSQDKAAPHHLSTEQAIKLPKGTTKKSLFLRKRANTALPPAAKPSPSFRSRLSPARARSSSSNEHFSRRATIAAPPSSTTPYLVGSATRLKKLKNFFGEEPPHLENLQSFLEGLGYEHLQPVFEAQQITLAELKYMDDAHFERLGVALGPRVKIQAELKDLQPLEASDVI